MKKTGLILCGLCLGFSNLSAQVTQNAVPSMAGWNYYGGDEFNGNKIDESKWGVYGDPKYNYKFDDYGNTEGQGGCFLLLRTVRAEQSAEGGTRICTGS